MASFQSGIRFPSGQPEWQNGMPQSMQRAPCAFSSGSASGSWYSTKSCTRSGIGRFGPFTRSILRKPPISPIARQNLLRRLLLGLRDGPVVGAALARRAPGTGGRDRGVLVLPGLAGAGGLLVTVAVAVRRDLPRLHRARAVAVAALGRDRGLAGHDRQP